MKQKGTSLVPQYVLAPFLTNLEAEMLTPELEVRIERSIFRETYKVAFGRDRDTSPDWSYGSKVLTHMTTGPH